MPPRVTAMAVLWVAATIHVLALCAAMPAWSGGEPTTAPESGESASPWNPFALEVVGRLETSDPGGDIAVAFTGGGTILAIDRVQFRLAGFDKHGGKRRGLLVTIDQASFEIADSTYTWDVKVIIDEATRGVVAFYTAYGELPIGPVREPSEQDLAMMLSSFGLYASTETNTKFTFSELIIRASCCGVPVSRAAGIMGRFMERHGNQRSIPPFPGAARGKSSVQEQLQAVVEPLWIVSGVDCPEFTVEIPGGRHVHAVMVESDRKECTSFDTR